MSRKPGDLILKDPNATEPQGVDWTAWLLELGAGIIISNSTWVVTGPDVLLTTASPSIVAPDSLKTQVYLAAGTPGARYTVTNRITTNSSPAVVDDRSFQVLVQDR